MRPQTLAIHAGRSIDPSTGAVTLPIHLSTTFERAADGAFASGFEYSRDNNPNRAALETCIARLERAETAVCFASGMAASCAVIESLPADAPCRVLMPNDVYFGLRALVAHTDIGRRFDCVAVDMTSIEAVSAALAAAATGLVWLETPSNPMLRVTDIARVATMAHESGALVAVDNTWATPLLQNPLALGADAVVHSLTKTLGGNCDLMVGAVALPAGSVFRARLKANQVHKGAVPSPFECWLALRGIGSLAPRLRTHCENADALARFLSGHAAVSRVHYPGLATHPGHETARRQMSAFGGMLSFEVEGGEAAAMAVAARLGLIARATSLGGPHSLIEHRASVEGPETTAPPGLLRLSAGLEHSDDLIDDLRQALVGV